jgi:hypothetical protein
MTSDVTQTTGFKKSIRAQGQNILELPKGTLNYG